MATADDNGKDFTPEVEVAAIADTSVPDSAGLALIEEASALKGKANALMKEKDFHNAGAIYEQAIALLAGASLEEQSLPLAATLHCNLAQCMLNLESWRRAEEAATRCLALESGNTKAMYRRSQALGALEQYFDAVRDLVKLRDLGGAGLPMEDLEKRCDLLWNKHVAASKATTSVEEVKELKRRFKVALGNYEFDAEDAAAEAAEVLFQEDAVSRVAEGLRMELADAEDVVKWLSSGLEFKIRFSLGA